MYVDTSSSTQHGKTYYRYLLRESYRESGKVKHRTLANLSHCSNEEIAAIKLALKHKDNLSALGTVEDIHSRQGLRIGAVFCLRAIAEGLGLFQALGHDRDGQIALWQVLARLIDQGSRLSAARLAESHAACDLLGLDAFHEDHLYSNLAWLAQNQETIEKHLFRRRYGSTPPQLFLYDVTSSYLEGVKNILAAFGYNRDGKDGKQQLVIGLLSGPDGTPVSVRVFEGNTQDPRTIPKQIQALANCFGVKEVTLVGDQGMLKQPQLELLKDQRFHYITAITKTQIRKFLKDGVFQMSLFDKALAEVEFEGGRYILRRNPLRAKEIVQNRRDKLASLQTRLAKENQYLEEHPRAKPEVAIRKVAEHAKTLKIKEWGKVAATGRVLEFVMDKGGFEQEAQLDGCYVIKTDLPVKTATAETIHDRYKDLAQVERAFRTFKNGHLEIRPTFVRTEASTRGHVFVVMLAYLLERELDRRWRHLEITIAEAIDELGSLRGVEISIGKATCQKVPHPTGLCEKLLEAASVRLPEALPLRKVHVATRKKISQQRK
ncbi:MAG: IS1634 family transposase [Deltaproteobacteria bacterium]|nr:IS1634 family transposase [Deltaproteobacteria bacterium]